MEDVQILQPGVDIKPIINSEEIKDLVLRLYGYKIIKITELVSYDDKNYHIIVDKQSSKPDNLSEEGYVLKIINNLDSKEPQFFEAQSDQLLYLREKSILCPKPVSMKDGSYVTKITLTSGEHIVRLLEFISGTVFNKVPCTPNLCFQAGEYVAKIDEALQDFRHPIYDSRKSLWMLKSVPQLRSFIFAVTDETKKAMALEIINEFETRVLSILDKLETRLIHGDFNEHNIIVEEKNEEWNIKAVIDFGDSHLASSVFEVAITMAYMIFQSREIDIGGYVLGGYSLVHKLSDFEHNLLKVCIAARMCQSLVLGAYSLLMNPDNLYVGHTSVHGWTTLENLWKEPEVNLLERWATISKRKP